jgi:hypothetical protein
MKEIFVKKYWAEDSIMFYLHFKDGEAVRQIEVTPSSKKYLTLGNPVQGDSMLYDQSIEDLDLDQSDYITESEFEIHWKEKKQ